MTSTFFSTAMQVFRKILPVSSASILKEASSDPRVISDPDFSLALSGGAAAGAIVSRDDLIAIVWRLGQAEEHFKSVAKRYHQAEPEPDAADLGRTLATAAQALSGHAPRTLATAPLQVLAEKVEEYGVDGPLGRFFTAFERALRQIGKSELSADGKADPAHMVGVLKFVNMFSAVQQEKLVRDIAEEKNLTEKQVFLAYSIASDAAILPSEMVKMAEKIPGLVTGDLLSELVTLHGHLQPRLSYDAGEGEQFSYASISFGAVDTMVYHSRQIILGAIPRLLSCNPELMRDAELKRHLVVGLLEHVRTANTDSHDRRDIFEAVANIIRTADPGNRTLGEIDAMIRRKIYHSIPAEHADVKAVDAALRKAAGLPSGDAARATLAAGQPSRALVSKL
jgi:hypothetical protein